jgi:hypothetical protein
VLNYAVLQPFLHTAGGLVAKVTAEEVTIIIVAIQLQYIETLRL